MQRKPPSLSCVGLAPLIIAAGRLRAVISLVWRVDADFAVAFEAEMAHVVNSCTCEWQSALSNLAVCASFAPFINSGGDASVQFETVRAQLQPL